MELDALPPQREFSATMRFRKPIKIQNLVYVLLPVILHTQLCNLTAC